MKIRKFLLEDSVDNYFTDLIVFDTEVELEDVKKAIQKVKDAFPTSYVCDDIFRALEELSTFTYTWLGDLETIKY